MTRARVLVADPPWQFGDRLGKRGADANYPTLPVAEICNFPLPPLAKDAYLFLWRVSAMQDEALAVARAWGFTVKTDMAWMKTHACGRCEGRGWTPINESVVIKVGGKATGLWCVACDGKGYKIAFGLGHHTRACKEICIIATRGRPTPISHSVRDIFHAPLGEHSAKPDLFYERVEQLARGPYVELFARRTRPGWTTYGNELNEAHP